MGLKNKYFFGFAKISFPRKVYYFAHYSHLQPKPFYDTLHKTYFGNDFKWNYILYELLIELLGAGSYLSYSFWLSQGEHWATYKTASFTRR